MMKNAAMVADAIAQRQQTTGVTDDTGFANHHPNSMLLPNLISIKGDYNDQSPAFAGIGTAGGATSANIKFSVTTAEFVELDATASIVDTWQTIQGSNTSTTTLTLTGPGAEVPEPEFVFLRRVLAFDRCGAREFAR